MFKKMCAILKINGVCTIQELKASKSTFLYFNIYFKMYNILIFIF